MANKKKEFIRSMKFVIFSISAGIVQVISDVLCNEVFKLTHWLSYFIALSLSVLWNFTLNRKFTFCSANNVAIAMTKVALFYAVFTPLSVWWTAYLTSNSVNWNEYVVLGGTMAVNFVTEYIYQRFVVFGKSIDTAKPNKKQRKS